VVNASVARVSSGAALTGGGTADGARPRVGLVVGAGGLKCAASIGLWKVLRREGIPVDLLVGCSGGSLYTACMALGYEADHIAELTARLWSTGLPRRLHYRSLLRAAFPRLFGRRRRIGLLDDSPFVRTVAEGIQNATFERLAVPLYLMATDLETGQRVTLSTGNVAEAVRASVAIPVWFRPWVIDGRLLIDGGLSDPMPVSVAIREGCDVIIAMGFEQPGHDNFGSLLGLIGQVTAISMNNLLRSTFAFYNLAHHAEVVPIIPPFDRRVSLRDTHLLPYIIERGEAAAEAELPYLRRLLGARAAVAAAPAAEGSR
jgi:NTE family protein